jgi:hypothetical protein
MNVRIIRLSDFRSIDSRIIRSTGLALPTFGDGWRFNFEKHARNASFQCYVLVTEDTPDVIEGCLIFRMKDAMEPYMAYIEIAPHNKGENRRFDRVAGCLIAFASRLSFIYGKDHFKGWLAFDVLEDRKEDEVKLMSVYCQKYGALKWSGTTMVISPERRTAGSRRKTDY